MIRSYRPRILILHRALAPYRLDLFEYLMTHYDGQIYLEYGQPLEQAFDLQQQRDRFSFDYHILAPGPRWAKNLRLGVIGLLRRHYDLVLCSEFNLLTLLLYCLVHCTYHRRPRLVVVCDDSPTNSVAVTRSRQWRAKRWLLRHVDGVVVCSEIVAEHYRHLAPHTKIHVLPIVQDENYLQALCAAESKNSQRLSALRNQYNLDDSTRVILCVGRLHTIKNLPELLRAFSQGFAEDPGVHLILVGDGEEEHRLRLLARQLPGGDRQIHFAGKQEGRALYAHYALADALVVASLHEAFGATTTEALAIGIPVAISQTAGSWEIAMASGYGSSLDPRDRASITEALHRALKQGEELETRMNRQTLLPYRFDEYMQQLSDYLSSLL